MKINIIINGHVRSFENTINSFNNCFKNVQKDIYLHCYNKLGHNEKVWWNSKGDNTDLKINIERIKQMYNPKKMIITDEQKFISNNKYYNEVGGYSAVHGMFFSMNEAFKLVENDGIILKTRYDIEYLNQVNSKQIDECYNTNTIFLLNTPHSHACRIYSDIIIMCRKEIFKKILKFNDVMDNYFSESIKHHNIIEGEQSFTKFMRENNNFNCQIKYLDLKCNLVRISGEKHVLYI